MKIFVFDVMPIHYYQYYYTIINTTSLCMLRCMKGMLRLTLLLSPISLCVKLHLPMNNIYEQHHLRSSNLLANKSFEL